jgi:hypothetical protein
MLFIWKISVESAKRPATLESADRDLSDVPVLLNV